MNKKSAIGIGTMIVFISGILAATIGAIVILHTQNRLQSESLRTGAEAREKIGTSVLMESIRAENIKNARAENFVMRTKLGPGSSSIRLNQTSLSVISRDSETTLLYGGIGEEKFFTNKENRKIEEKIGDSFVRLRTDLDGDYIEDYFKVENSTSLLFNLSSEGLISVEIPDISIIGTEVDFIVPIGNLNSHIQVQGTINTPNLLDKDMNVIISPNEIGRGIYSIEYSIRGGRDIKDTLLFGDVIRIYFETAHPLKEGTTMSINFYSATSVAYTREVLFPSVMTASSVILFP